MTPFTRTGLQVAGAFGALLITFGIGAGSTSAKTVEVERVVEVTPAACQRYIDLSEQVLGYASEGLGYSSDAMEAAARFNISGIEASTAKLDTLALKVEALSPQVIAAKAECRGY
ncbi:hypothetical protein [Pseudarthrobacter sp. SSS035]|uniref:hypothetical protein n=1 Tax=Pseudarthrobacter sp. SSS035 TaxID=2931399 RepID=UPI00200D2B60|nr:hypothetical protein [Pseudarthrobacter sp. SSS035]